MSRLGPPSRSWCLRGATAVAALWLAASGAGASQLADNALEAWNAGQYELSARWFYALLAESKDRAEIAEAEYGMAASAERLGLKASGAELHRRVVKRGGHHAYFDKSVEALAELGFQLGDVAITPAALQDAYAPNRVAFAKLPPNIVQSVFLHLGARALRSDDLAQAEKHLKTVTSKHPRFGTAQHLLARVQIHATRKTGPDLDRAHAHLDEAERAVAEGGRMSRSERVRLQLLSAWVRGQRSKLLTRKKDKTQELGPALGFRRDLREKPTEKRAHLLARGVAEVVVGERQEALEDLHLLRQMRSDPEVQLLYSLILLEMCELDKASIALKKTHELLETSAREARALLDAYAPYQIADATRATELFPKLRQLPGMSVAPGLGRFLRGVDRDLAMIDEGALGKGGLPDELTQTLRAQQASLRAARGKELVAATQKLLQRWKTGQGQVLAAQKLVSREKKASRCPSRPPDAAAAAYGMGLLQSRSR